MASTKPIKPLCCCVCDTDIFRYNNIYKKKEKAKNYAEATIFFTSGSRMVIGVCKECKEKLTKRKITTIMNRHKVFWKDQIMTNVSLTTEEKVKQVKLLDDFIVETWK